MRSLILTFEEGELLSTIFQHPLASNSLVTVRGRTAGASRVATGTFQWTTGVQALAVLLLGTKLSSIRRSPAGFTLQGRAGSLALSLDNAISKDVNWLQDMFGCDSAGNALSKRITLRTNSSIKHPGPVIIAINQNFLPPAFIEVRLPNGADASLEQIAAIYEKVSGSTLDVTEEKSSTHFALDNMCKPAAGRCGEDLKNRYELEIYRPSLSYIARYG